MSKEPCRQFDSVKLYFLSPSQWFLLLLAGRLKPNPKTHGTAVISHCMKCNLSAIYIYIYITKRLCLNRCPLHCKHNNCGNILKLLRQQFECDAGREIETLQWVMYVLAFPSVPHSFLPHIVLLCFRSLGSKLTHQPALLFLRDPYLLPATNGTKTHHLEYYLRRPSALSSIQNSGDLKWTPTFFSPLWQNEGGQERLVLHYQ